MSKEMKTGIAARVAQLAQFRLERLDYIRETMLGSIQGERQRIAEMAKDAEGDYLDSQADEDHFLFEAEETVGGLLLVGLYSAVEHFTKQLLRHRYPDEIDQFYKIEKLQKALAKDCNVNLASVVGFQEIDELRHKTNQVKHGGAMGESALAAYGRLRSAVVPYLERLALVVVPD